MSDKRVQEIEARLKAATPGEWEWIGNDLHAKPPSYDVILETPRASCSTYGCCGGHGIDARVHDKALISEAPADLAYLLSEVQRLSTLLTMGKPDPRGLEAAIATETAINKAQVKEDW